MYVVNDCDFVCVVEKRRKAAGPDDMDDEPKAQYVTNILFFLYLTIKSIGGGL